MAVAVAVSGGVAVPVAVPVVVPVAGLTKRFFNHIQKDFLINVWGYCRGRTFLYFCFFSSAPCGTAPSRTFQENWDALSPLLNCLLRCLL